MCLLGVKIDILGGIGYNHGIQTNEVGVMAFDQTKYINDFAKEKYDRIAFQVPKGKREILKTLAKERNITDDRGKVSVNRLIVEALEQTYKIDLSKPE